MASGTSGAAPHTTIVPGQGSSSVTYTLPAGIYQYIESVVATVDTSGSGDVTAVLTVADDSGTVIADKEQARAITAGGSGRATWALRLTDETIGGGAAAIYEVNSVEVGQEPALNFIDTATVTWHGLDEPGLVPPRVTVYADAVGGSGGLFFYHNGIPVP